jgi:integrase
MRILLTDRFVAGAKSDGSAQVEFFDAKTIGLSLRVSRKGMKSWSFSFTTANSKRARVTLGSFPAVSLAAARGLALEARGAVQSGQDPRLHRAGAMTLAALIESYISKHVCNLRSAKQIERRFRRNVIPMIGDVRLADLHRRDFNRVVDPVLGRGCPIEANRVFGDLRAVLHWAIARGDLDRDPSTGMVAPSSPRIRDRTLNDDEIRRLWNVLPKVFPNSISVQRILRLCLVTAQRVGEVTGMQRGELDLKARLWSLPGTRTKNGFAHQVPLSDLAISIIEEAIADAAGSSRLFDLPAVAVARFVGRAQGKFGIFPPWTPHDLRRSALSGMAALGVAPVVLGHIANHRGTTKAGITLAVYIRHDYSREKREALDLWAARLAAIVSDDATAKVVPLRGA